MIKLYIISGLPFAGKSQLAKEMVEITGAVLVSFDALWQEQQITDPGITYEKNIELIETRLREILRSGRSAIYDSTNLREEHRNNFASLARECGAEPVVVFLDVSVVEIKARRAQSLLDKTHHEVSDDNFDNALSRIEIPAAGVIIRSEEDKLRFLKTLAK